MKIEVLNDRFRNNCVSKVLSVIDTHGNFCFAFDELGQLCSQIHWGLSGHCNKFFSQSSWVLFSARCLFGLNYAFVGIKKQQQTFRRGFLGFGLPSLYQKTTKTPNYVSGRPAGEFAVDWLLSRCTGICLVLPRRIEIRSVSRGNIRVVSRGN